MLHKAVVITAALTLACGAVAVGAVPSGAESGTHCTFQHVPDLKPGVSYNPSSGNFIDPVAEYSHSEGISITGGFVYRGTALPQLVGLYIFGDFGSGAIWSVQSSAPYTRTFLVRGSNISTFGQGADGELYVADLGSGQISKLVPP